jgi:uncharacterized membrane protein
MPKIHESVDVQVPIRVAYDQWTQFESFPQFMEGVERIEQLTDTRTHWVTKVGGVTRELDDRRNHWVTRVGGVAREFDTEIAEQRPDERIAWHSVGGDVQQEGLVTFEQLEDDITRVTIRIDWEPQGPAEHIGAAVGVDDRQVRSDAEGFKDYIESRGRETGAWRGEID